MGRALQIAIGAALGVLAAIYVVRAGWFPGLAPMHHRAMPAIGSKASSEPAPESTTAPQAFWSTLPLQAAGEQHSPVAKLAQDTAAGVVNVHTSKTVTREVDPFGGFPFEMFPEFFGRGGRRQQEPREQQFKVPSLGSGFVISPDGYILTNNHVVEGVDEIKVFFSDGAVRDAKIVGQDPKTDLALIQVKGAKDLKALPLGDSDAILPGDFVVAIGNPFGLDHTVTLGIVSAKGRELGQGPYDDYIQTDAAINPGNSGGPLLDLRGEVIGINSAINPQANTIGFAVPINIAKSILPQLREHGAVTRGWLGVTVQVVTPELAAALKLESQKGALVGQVVPGGPADKAGVKHGDVIETFAGKVIDKPRDLSRTVAATEVGKSVELGVVRDGKHVTLKARIEKLAGAPEAAEKSAAKPEKAGATSLGITVQDVDDSIRQQLGMPDAKGPVITDVEPGSPAANAGLEPGDLIVEVDRKPVGSAADVDKRIASAGDSVLFLIRRGDATLFVAVNRKG
ncbi:MAG TPA: Do family serine endopeptidase [Myxococcota bacterium]|nr:Do family serine endopeptidase [Myxococcota bacterium]